MSPYTTPIAPSAKRPSVDGRQAFTDGGQAAVMIERTTALRLGAQERALDKRRRAGALLFWALGASERAALGHNRRPIGLLILHDPYENREGQRTDRRRVVFETERSGHPNRAVLLGFKRHRPALGRSVP